MEGGQGVEPPPHKLKGKEVSEIRYNAEREPHNSLQRVFGAKCAANIQYIFDST